MERETRKFTVETPSGNKEVEIYTYATGREARAINSKYASSIKMDMKGSEPTIKDFDMSVASSAEDDKIKFIVVSFDNSKDDILNRILDLPENAYNKVISEIDSVLKKKE